MAVPTPDTSPPDPWVDVYVQTYGISRAEARQLLWEERHLHLPAGVTHDDITATYERAAELYS